jgi:hypothetical protein
MINGVILLWFVLTALSLLFVVIDIRSTPASPVLKWGFILLVAYTGVFGAFLYVLGCREPLRGTHEQYVAARWRQVLGSTMHCVAGDGVGILAGAAISSVLQIHGLSEIGLEYLLGFAFGWTIFQSLFMRDMAGGSYTRSLFITFVPELLSMNVLMAGMAPMMMILRRTIAPSSGPASPAFWFVMSMALLVGFIIAYPMNWWLVANSLKHGMLTVRPTKATAPAGSRLSQASGGEGPTPKPPMDHKASAPVPPVPVMAALSFLILAAGLGIAWIAMHG